MIKIMKISVLFSPGWSKSKSLLDVLPNWHGAEDVQEDKAAVGVVVAQKIYIGFRKTAVWKEAKAQV